jgi:hypothetical protein
MSAPSFSVVCWKWHTPGYRSTFGPEQVNVLRRMVKRNLSMPHRFICVTDRPDGIDPDVEVVPLWDDFASVPSPHGRGNPSCYRRLKAFSAEISDVFGPRFVSIDLDTVVTGSLDSLFDRPEDFWIWGQTDERTNYNGSLWMMSAGARRQVYDRFDPKTSPREAYLAGKFGSDQGWISHVLGKGEKVWSTADGVYSFRKHIAQNGNQLPANARLVNWHGRIDPWSHKAQQIPWVKEHYR